MAGISNINLNNTQQTINTGAIGTFFDPGIIRAVVFVPKGNIIPPSAMESASAFQTYVLARLQSNSRGGATPRWPMLTPLSEPKDDTAKGSTQTIGLDTFHVTEYNTVITATYTAAFGNILEALKLRNTQNIYDFYFVDTFGTWYGTLDPNGSGGLMAYTSHQIWISNRMFKTDKNINTVEIALLGASAVQFNENMKLYSTGGLFTPDSVLMPINAWLQDVTATLATPLGITPSADTDMVVVAKAGQFSQDIGLAYQGIWTVACFSIVDINTGLAVGSLALHAQGSITVAGQVYNYLWFKFTAVTSGDVLQCSLTTPSVVQGVLTGNTFFDCQQAAGNAGGNVNGAPCAVYTLV